MDSQTANVNDENLTIISDVVQNEFQKHMEKLEQKSKNFIKSEHLMDIISGFIDEKLPLYMNAKIQRTKPKPTSDKSSGSGDSKTDLNLNLNKDNERYFKNFLSVLEERISHLEDCLDTLQDLATPDSVPHGIKRDRCKKELKALRKPSEDLYYEWRIKKLDQPEFTIVDHKTSKSDES